jgi:nicotinamide mononucleotide adenylyltransferase
MMNGVEKLKKDLQILKAMVEELANYLESEAILWPMFKADYPQMTLGGYFMRQRRLQILSYLLSDVEQAELKGILIQFGDMTMDRKAVLMKKGMEELRMRLNQWKGHLQEYWESETIEKEFYATDAEVRTMIADLLFELDIDLYLVDKELLEQMDALDEALKRNWQEGDFIWPEDWIPAYGKGDYWWLYGKPRNPNHY